MRVFGALVLAVGVADATASCSSDPKDDLGEEDASTPLPPALEAGSLDGGGAEDGGPTDASARDADAIRPDASQLPVVCAGASCATSLVTSMGEGFCVLLQDKTVACWGENANRQLGRGPDVDTTPSGTPARVLNLTDIVALDRACAIDANGDTWCWGTGPWLRTSAATTTEHTPVKLPIPPAKMIRVARSSTNAGTACALVDDGLLCWGTNVNGQVMVPVPGAAASKGYPPTEAGVPPGAPIRDLAMGAATFTILDDGTALSWGANPPIGRVSGMFPDPYPRPVALSDVLQIDAANDNVCAVAAFDVYCWGRPKGTSLGGLPPLDRALPERIVMPESVVFVTTPGSPNNTSNPLRGCAIGASGSLYCWGENARGQVGDGTRDYALSPVKITGLPEPVAQVRTTALATCALLTSGRVFCWGDDSLGQLGGGQLRVASLVPKEVALP